MFDFSTQLWRLRAGIFCKMKKIEDLKQFIIENWSKEKADQIPASDFAVQISNIEEIKRNFNEEDKTYFVERKYKASVLILGILKTSGESTLAALVRKYFQEFGHPADEYTVSSEELLILKSPNSLFTNGMDGIEGWMGLMEYQNRSPIFFSYRTDFII